MAKLNLADLTSLTNEQSAIATINDNSALIEAALEATLSRDGTTPNQMEADFDMNSHHILNLPEPGGMTEPLRLQDLTDFVGGSLVIDSVTLPTLASQSEAEAGVENTHYMSPLRTKQAVDFQVADPLTLASQAEAQAGVENTHYMSALRTKQAIDALSSSSTFVQTGTGASTRSLSSKLKDQALSVKDFGAVGDSTTGADGTDNITAFTNCFAAAVAQNKPVYIPSGKYRVAGDIGVSALIPIIGDGKSKSIWYYTGSGTALVIVPPAEAASVFNIGTDGNFLQDFSIEPAVDGTGVYGIEIRPTVAGSYGYFQWQNVRLGKFGSESLYLNNSAAGSGFYVGRFDCCDFKNSVLGVNIGDSLEFHGCKMHGTKAFSVSSVAGSRRLVVRNCSITTSGGIDFNPSYGVDFAENHVEIFSGTNYSGATNALLRFNNCTEVQVSNNRIAKVGTGTKPNDTIRLAGTTSGVIINGNEMPKGNNTHILADATTSDIVIGRLTVDEGYASQVVTLPGTRSTYVGTNVTIIGDANYAILPVDSAVVTSGASFTAPRTWTLPLANAVFRGQRIVITDGGGSINGANTLTLARAGSDTIQGGTTFVLGSQGNGVVLISNGTNAWYYPVYTIAAGGTGAPSASGARTNLGLGTAATVNTGTSGATIPLLNGANTWSGAQTISTTGIAGLSVNTTVSGAAFQATSTDSGSVAGPGLVLSRQGGSQAAADLVGFFQFVGQDSANNAWPYASLQCIIEDPTDGSEDGSLNIFTSTAGAFAQRMKIQDGIQIGGTYSSDPGLGALLASTSIKSNGPTSGIGYATGAGGTVTQATNRTTGVTLNKITGQITTNNTSLAAGAAATFTVTNSAVAATDTIILSVQSGLVTVQSHVSVTAVAAGSFNITVDNQSAATAETGTIVINFAVIKGVTS